MIDIDVLSIKFNLLLPVEEEEEEEEEARKVCNYAKCSFGFVPCTYNA